MQPEGLLLPSCQTGPGGVGRCQGQPLGVFLSRGVLKAAGIHPGAQVMLPSGQEGGLSVPSPWSLSRCTTSAG